MRESGFLRFKSTRDRDQFVEKLIREVPGIERKCHVSQVRPQIVVEHLTAEEQQQISQRLRDDVEWFDQVAFDTLRPQP